MKHSVEYFWIAMGAKRKGENLILPCGMCVGEIRRGESFFVIPGCEGLRLEILLEGLERLDKGVVYFKDEEWFKVQASSDGCPIVGKSKIRRESIIEAICEIGKVQRGL